LADKIRLSQNIVSAYECDRLGMQSDLLVRFALALEVSADELLGLKRLRRSDDTPSLKLLRRIKRILIKRILALPLFHQ